MMPDFEIEISSHALRLDGELDLLFQPGAVTAFSGSFKAGTVPVRSGRWQDLPRRFFEPDRFMLRRGVLDGSLWLSSCQTPYVQRLPLGVQDSLWVVTRHLLCAGSGARMGSRRLRLVPGSTTKTLTVTEMRATEGENHLPPVVATLSPLNQAILEEDQVLHVNPGAVVAWSGCAFPKPFCASLRLRDMFLPRLPETLTLDFRGPGRVFFQGAVPSARQGQRAKKAMM